MLLISLPRIFEDQGSGYPLRVSKVTLKWTGPVQIFTKGQLGSNLVYTYGWVSLAEVDKVSPVTEEVCISITGGVSIVWV